MRRILRIDVCDYHNNAVCNLYDSATNVSGGAVNVFLNSERNGWKELSFEIPSKCMTENGLEDNYRLQYLIADYRLRAVIDNETDWYLISEPAINHNNKSKNVEVTAGHICQLLKNKQMNLEFSMDEGNNVGTCEELLTAILDGTGWAVGEVARFYEDNGKDEKHRTLVESTGVGAFKMISDLCELFDAKPIYHGDSRTVDIKPMNPFSVELITVNDETGYGKKIRLEEGQIPELQGENVLELHYDKEVKGIKRTLNTENIITKLYAYGAYGERTTGACSLTNLNHDEYVYTATIKKGTEYKITDKDSAVRYFTATESSTNAKLIYSRLDFASRGYIWNDKTKKAYRVYETPNGKATPIPSVDPVSVTNNVPFLMDFHYYDEVGLLTDEMLQMIATYQRTVPELNQISKNKSAEFEEAKSSLSEVGQDNTGFLKLKVRNYTTGDAEFSNQNYLKIVIDTRENDGIIYRSDYNERNHFTWHTAKSLKANGDPAYGSPSMVWILHNTDPVTYEMLYLKQIDKRRETTTDFYGVVKEQAADYTYGVSEGRPEEITLWGNYSNIIDRLDPNTDHVYLFCTNSTSGSLGTALSDAESIAITLENKLKQETVRHPIYFEDVRDGTGEKSTPTSSLQSIISNDNGYGWAYLHNPDKPVYVSGSSELNLGKLFFCYHQDGDEGWHRALCQDTEPSAADAKYFYNTRENILYRSDGTNWIKLDPSTSLDYKNVATAFGTVWKYCLRWEELYKGKSEYYTYTHAAAKALVPGNYAMSSPFGYYWVFTTDKSIAKNKTLKINISNNNVYQADDEVNLVETQVKSYDVIEFPAKNILSRDFFKVGIIDPDTGADKNEVGDAKVRSVSIPIHNSTTYAVNVPNGSYCVLYDLKNGYLDSRNIGANTTLEIPYTISVGTDQIPHQVGYVRLVCPKSVLTETKLEKNTYYMRVQEWQNTLFVNDIKYTILNPVVGEGTNKGVNNLIARYPELADNAYQTLLPAYEKAQKDINNLDNQLANTLQDILRESRWQEPNYIESDADKLYDDAIDTLHEVSRPEATYEIDFLDLYASNKLTEDDDIEWPDIEVTNAVHLVDPEIGINLWGYVDRLNKCYDQPWKTTLEVNTKLTNMGQHSFADVMTKIAEVAKQAKNKQSIYERAAVLSASGQLLAEKLEGTIKANKALISGDVGNWYTNEKGQIVFESESGQFAMMLSGAGLMIANGRDPNGDWNWRSTMTGAGLTADEIVFGEMSGQRITAHTITAEHLTSSVGSELDIGSNVALTMYATTDGYRPAGSLDTQSSVEPKVASDESFIQILPARKDENDNAIPAAIYIKTGGLLDLEGSEVAITSNSTMKLDSGSAMDISAGGSLNINVSGKNGNTGTFTVNSSNFKIDGSGNVTMLGTVTATGGNIAGFTILNKTVSGVTTASAMYAGNVDNLKDTGDGIYLGTDGINVGGKLVVSKDGGTIKFGDTKLSVDAVSGTIDLAGAAVNVTADSDINISADEKLNLTTNGTILLGKTGAVFTIGADGSGSSARAFIYNGKTNKSDTTHNGVYLGTDGIIVGKANGNYFQALADGTVNLTGNITAASGSIGGWVVGTNHLGDADTINGSTIGMRKATEDTQLVFFAGADGESASTATFKVTKGGKVTMSNAVISGGSITISDGTTTNFKVTSDGTLTAKKGTIANWTLGTNYLGSGSTKVLSRVGMGSGTSDNTVVFWAGHTTSSEDMTDSSFYVTAGGALHSTSGRIGGWYIGDDYLGNKSTLATSTIGLYSGDVAVDNTVVSIWAGGTRANAKFKVTATGALTSTFGTIGGWTIGSDLSRTVANKGTVTLGTGDYAINVNNATDGKNKFTVGYDGYLTSTYGSIAGWQIKDECLYKNVPDKGFIYIGGTGDENGSYKYAINVNNMFMVDYEGNTTIKGLKVDGKSIDFSTFESAASISGSWSGTTFNVTASLWNGKLTKSASMSASVAIEFVNVTSGSGAWTYAGGKAGIVVKIGGSEAGFEVTDVSVDASPAYQAGWEESENQFHRVQRTLYYQGDAQGNYYPWSGTLYSKS